MIYELVIAEKDILVMALIKQITRLTHSLYKCDNETDRQDILASLAIAEKFYSIFDDRNTKIKLITEMMEIE